VWSPACRGAPLPVGRPRPLTAGSERDSVTHWQLPGTTAASSLALATATVPRASCMRCARRTVSTEISQPAGAGRGVATSSSHASLTPRYNLTRLGEVWLTLAALWCSPSVWVASGAEVAAGSGPLAQHSSPSLRANACL
jgi:hypothetical protein